jgi:ABC-type branched-subunit amino acid transport system ATPase component
MESLATHKRARAGLARTFQSIELYDDLSVEENVSVGLAAARSRLPRRSHQTLAGTLDLLGIAALRHRPAGQLSQGQRQLVSMARALVGQPEVLLLDEPSGGLDSRESSWLGDRLRAIRDAGVTILIVDHDMHLVLNLCDEIRVLNFGEEIAFGSPEAIRGDRAVAAAYLGDTHAGVAAEAS